MTSRTGRGSTRRAARRPSPPSTSSAMVRHSLSVICYLFSLRFKLARGRGAVPAGETLDYHQHLAPAYGSTLVHNIDSVRTRHKPTPCTSLHRAPGITRLPILEGEVSHVEIPRTNSSLGVTIVGGSDTPLRCVVVQEVRPHLCLHQHLHPYPTVFCFDDVSYFLAFTKKAS